MEERGMGWTVEKEVREREKGKEKMEKRKNKGKRGSRRERKEEKGERELKYLSSLRWTIGKVWTERRTGG